ncbi:hypothetical protein CsSME_00029200 [Camellia sinensis var. sinensis]
MNHFTYEGELLKIKLDNYSGAGFSSKSKYLFGKVKIQIKLVEVIDFPSHNLSPTTSCLAGGVTMDPCPFVRLTVANLALMIPVASKPARSPLVVAVLL